jgi:hypothetical protein
MRTLLLWADVTQAVKTIGITSMSRLKIISTIIVAILISGCGAEVTPTINPVDVQNTAISGAFTLVAETQAAIPTATPVPPTETATQTQTPLPTNTPLTLPTSLTTTTLTPLAVAASTSTAGGDPCLTRILSWSPKGRPANIRIVNTTRAAITVSIYLNETDDHFECGYRVYDIASRSDLFITDLVQGCYSIWAFNDDQKIPVNAFGFGCINNPDKWTIEIFQDSVKGL